MVNRQIEHSSIPPVHCHEPKGIETAEANSVYVADGAGSGDWTVLPQLLRSSAYPIGFVKPFAGNNPPPGWFLCDGGLLSRIIFQRLFSVIGTAYGLGDGATTFGLPDLRGRLTIGRDNMGGTAAGRITTSGSGIDGMFLGASGGSEVSALVTDNLPDLSASTSVAGAHTHTASTTIGSSGSGLGGGAPNVNGSAAVAVSITALSAGSHSHTYTINSGSPNTPHNNVQPTFIMNKIIYHGVANA